jgi:hypothetical protein
MFSVYVAVTLAAGADGSDIQLFIRGFESEALQRSDASESGAGDRAGHQAANEEVAARYAFLTHTRSAPG